MELSIWNRAWPKVFVIFFMMLGFQSRANAETPQPKMDLITHSEITVKATASDIWPYIVNPNAWKRGAKLVPVGGGAGGVGQKFEAVEGGKVQFLAENAEFVPAWARTIRLSDLDGVLNGYASWRLVERGDATLVQYDVYCLVPVPGQFTPPSVSALGLAMTRFRDAQVKRYAEELQDLAALVEAEKKARSHR
jgi:hypothetical protein